MLVRRDKDSLSPSRKRMAMSHPGKWTVIVCGPWGGVDWPNSVVLSTGLTAAMLTIVAGGR